MSSSEKFQKFLDSQQYTRKGILLYEHIFGRTYVSTGGPETTERFCKELGLHQADQKVHVGPARTYSFDDVPIYVHTT